MIQLKQVEAIENVIESAGGGLTVSRGSLNPVNSPKPTGLIKIDWINDITIHGGDKPEKFEEFGPALAYVKEALGIS